MSFNLTPGRTPGIHATPLDAPCPACTGTGRLHSCPDFPVPSVLADRVNAVLAEHAPNLPVPGSPEAARTGTPAEVLRFIESWLPVTVRFRVNSTRQHTHRTYWVEQTFTPVPPVPAPPAVCPEYVAPEHRATLPVWVNRPSVPSGVCDRFTVALPGIGRCQYVNRFPAMPVPVTPVPPAGSDPFVKEVRKLRERIAKCVPYVRLSDPDQAARITSEGSNVRDRRNARQNARKRGQTFTRSAGVGAVPVPRRSAPVLPSMTHPSELPAGTMLERSLHGIERKRPERNTGRTVAKRRTVRMRPPRDPLAGRNADWQPVPVS
jgi:hypothetical protein